MTTLRLTFDLSSRLPILTGGAGCALVTVGTVAAIHAKGSRRDTTVAAGAGATAVAGRAPGTANTGATSATSAAEKTSLAPRAAGSARGP
ncbi:hypothetical protein, partial [Mycobacterium marinum]